LTCATHFPVAVYVLKAPLQSGFGIPRWDPRTQSVCIWGFPTLAGHRRLVLSFKPVTFSPQYHIVFDDDFLPSNHTLTVTVDATWKNAFGLPADRFADAERAEAMSITELFSSRRDLLPTALTRPYLNLTYLEASHSHPGVPTTRTTDRRQPRFRPPRSMPRLASRALLPARDKPSS
jgi:hypothetical protein